MDEPLPGTDRSAFIAAGCEIKELWADRIAWTVGVGRCDHCRLCVEVVTGIAIIASLLLG